jgi:hypothetical protein
MLTQSTSTVALTNKGTSVTDPITVPRWRSQSDGNAEVMRASLSFGPFPAETSFDGALINVAGAVEPVRFASLIVLAAGMTFAYDVEMRFTKDPS